MNDFAIIGSAGANVGEVADQLAAVMPFSAICLDVGFFVLGRVLSPAGLMGRGKRYKAALKKVVIFVY